jgi:hypothetical protein
VGFQVAERGVERVDEMVEREVEGFGQAEAAGRLERDEAVTHVRHMRIPWIRAEPSSPYPLIAAAATATAWSLTFLYSSSPGVGACTLAA